MILFRSLKHCHNSGQYLTFLILLPDWAASVPHYHAIFMLSRGNY